MDRFKMFNCFFIIILLSIIITGIVAFYIRYERIEYEFRNERIDTVYVYVEDSTTVAQIDSLYSVIDSLETINYKYEDELNIAVFKLERIRNYNEIAKNGNNIKYLRGWINRVLDE